MKQIQFAQWAEVLARSDVPENKKQSWIITLRWYLSFCRRGRAPITVQSARDFIQWAQREKKPEPWQLERWKEALRWFFKTAPRPAAGATAQSAGGARPGGLPKVSDNPHGLVASNASVFDVVSSLKAARRRGPHQTSTKPAAIQAREWTAREWRL